MPIILSQTYEIVTEESASYGAAEDRGYDWQDCEHTFRETVDIIRHGGFTEPSCSHGVPSWLSTEPVVDYRSGKWEIKSLHPGNDARSKRYWAKACRVAGVCK